MTTSTPGALSLTAWPDMQRSQDSFCMSMGAWFNRLRFLKILQKLKPHVPWLSACVWIFFWEPFACWRNYLMKPAGQQPCLHANSSVQHCLQSALLWWLPPALSMLFYRGSQNQHGAAQLIDRHTRPSKLVSKVSGFGPNRFTNITFVEVCTWGIFYISHAQRSKAQDTYSRHNLCIYSIHMLS